MGHALIQNLSTIVSSVMYNLGEFHDLELFFFFVIHFITTFLAIHADYHSIGEKKSSH